MEMVLDVGTVRYDTFRAGVCTLAHVLLEIGVAKIYRLVRGT